MRWDWKALVGIAISALLIWWILRDVDVGEVWEEVRRADLLLLLAAVAVATSGFLIRAMRWKIFLHPIRPGTRLWNRFAAVNIGFAANNLLPARVGEFARAWSISKLESVAVSGGLGSLVVERFLDGVAIFLLLLVALLHPSFTTGATVGGTPIGATLTALVLTMCILLITLALLLTFPRPVVALTHRIARSFRSDWGRRISDILESFLSGLGALRDPRLLLQGFIWSVGFWSWNAVSFWLAFRAFGIEEGYVTALFVQAVIALGVAVPSAPGFFGTFHAAAVVALHEVYGVDEGATLAFAFGYHLGGFIPVTLMGLWYAGQLGMGMEELGRVDEAVVAQLDRDVHDRVQSSADPTNSHEERREG